MADACGVVSTAVRSTVSCSNVLAALLEAATTPSIAYTPGASTWPSAAASGILAITTPDNNRSEALLEKLGFKFERTLNERHDETLKLFSLEI